MIKSRKKQQGATLFVALMLLVMMTLFAVSSINTSTVNLKIVGNMQATKAIDAEAQVALEQVISESSNFSSTATATTVGDVIVAAPVCISSETASGYSAVQKNIIPEDNTWEIVATIDDSITGATSTIHSGVEMRMLADNCP